MGRVLDILLIEDDIDDVDLLKEALEDNNVAYEMQVIMEGDKVMDHIHDGGRLPGVIIMDLNLPKADGKEILKHIKCVTAFSAVPIVVLTTSSAKEDVDYCERLGITKFLTKPATIDGWNYTIELIKQVASV